MATTLKLRRGTTTQHSTFTGALGEVTVDTDKDVIVVHDGSTAGGFPAIRAGGALGTPSSGTVTNLTGTASININGTVGATTPAAGTFTSLSDSGNLTFTGTGNRITGDFSTTTFANRVMFQTSTVNGNTSVGVLPNGTATTSSYNVFNNADPTNSGYGQLRITSSAVDLISGITGTGTYLPMTFYTGGSERMRISTTGTGLVSVGRTGGFTGSETFTANGFATFGSTSAPQVLVGDTGAGFGVLGTYSNHALEFRTNNSGRMYIDTSGNVGIGTSSPANRLHVKGAWTSNEGQFQIDADSGQQFSGMTLQNNGTYKALFYNDNTNLLTFLTTASGSNQPLLFGTNEAERMRIDTSGNVGIGTSATTYNYQTKNVALYDATSAGISIVGGSKILTLTAQNVGGIYVGSRSNDPLILATNDTERARITAGGDFVVGTTTTPGQDITSGTGMYYQEANGFLYVRSDGQVVGAFNRGTNDGVLIEFKQDQTIEGTISVSGTTVSYNGGHLARYSQLLNGQRDESIVKGTVLSNLDEMCEWFDAEGNPMPNEQLNRTKVSDVEGDTNVAGVFVNWDNDDQDNPYDMNIAMTGDMIIRIAQGVVVQRGDLLMSAGNGTAKPQGDDIVRSKTIAKVTSNHVTCTYDDGSYCVPCVLMAC